MSTRYAFGSVVIININTHFEVLFRMWSCTCTCKTPSTDEITREEVRNQGPLVSGFILIPYDNCDI